MLFILQYALKMILDLFFGIILTESGRQMGVGLGYRETWQVFS